MIRDRQRVRNLRRALDVRCLMIIRDKIALEAPLYPVDIIEQGYII